MNGLMTQQWTVWCISCHNFDQISGSKSSAKREFKKSGWFLLNKKWICPRCLEEYIKEQVKKNSIQK